MKIVLVRSFLLFAAVYCFIAANYNNTNSNLLGDNNSVPPNVAKYVTPFGTGDHSGSSWNNAYSFKDMQGKLASNTSYNLVDSTFLVDSIIVKDLVNISFIGKSKSKTILEGISSADREDTLSWSLKCFDLDNVDFAVIKDLQIRRFRWFGIRVGSFSSSFLGYNLYVDSCGWAAWGAPIGPPLQEIKSPGGVKLFGDNGTFRQSTIKNSGWDGMQVAGYDVLVDSTTIDSAGVDEPGAKYQGDGIHIFRNPDISYNVNGQTIHKAGRLTVNECYINTAHPKKSGIEAGYKDPQTEKPLLRAYNSYIAGGKGIGITQSNDLIIGEFYSDVQNCTIVNLKIDRWPLRIENWDAGTPGKIKNNIFLCPVNYPFGQCPVGECNTLPNAVTYEDNRWKKGNDWQPIFCAEPIPDCISEE